MRKCLLLAGVAMLLSEGVALASPPDAPDKANGSAPTSTSSVPDAGTFTLTAATASSAGSSAPASAGRMAGTGDNGTSNVRMGRSNAVVDASGLIDGDAAANAASAAKVAAVATDPELASMLRAAAGPVGALTWDETATRDYYNGTIGLAWRHTLGDYDPKSLGSALVTDTDSRKVVDFSVTGNDFLILNNGDSDATFDSRHGPAAYQPVLIVNGRYKYKATRNVYLSPSTVSSLGSAALMHDAHTMLLAFDNYAPQPGDVAHLQLVTEQQYGTHNLTVHGPAVQPVYPKIDATPGGKTVADIRASNFTLSGGNKVVANNILTATWGGNNLTALSQVFSLPPADEYFLTVVIRLGADWSDQGGKLPGLSDTGLGLNTSGAPLTINGVVCNNSGWGGRPANGCRWSARTGWGGRSGNLVGLHTYYYAQRNTSFWGEIQNWPTPAPTGQWFAYVERVKMNTIGKADGRLSYWICTQSGCHAQVDRGNITWRSHDLPESKITEVWADVYCGGTSCGPTVIPTSTVSLSRMTVTTGLPDLNALGTEVRALNASGH